MNLRRAMSVSVLAVALSACSAASGIPSPTASTATAASPAAAGGSSTLTVYAAASLKAVLAKVSQTYEAANAGMAITVSTDSSAALETKIEQGAPADVFLAADTANPQKLVDKGLASGSVVKFAGNLLTVIVPASNPAGIQTPADLARAGVKVIAAGDNVPITKYANQLVANLSKQAGYPGDFVAAYDANVVSKEDNAAAVVSKIELGEGDAAIVYMTDARTTNVTEVAVPSGANVPATYGGVVVRTSPNPAAATAFLSWLAGPDGQAIFASFGFLPAS